MIISVKTMRRRSSGTLTMLENPPDTAIRNARKTRAADSRVLCKAVIMRLIRLNWVARRPLLRPWLPEGKHDRLAAGLFDLLLGGLAEAVCAHGELPS